MTDQELRVECLRMANAPAYRSNKSPTTKDIRRRARKLYEFVTQTVEKKKK